MLQSALLCIGTRLDSSCAYAGCDRSAVHGITIANDGSPGTFFASIFASTPDSGLDKNILNLNRLCRAALTLQLIGESIPDLVRTAREVEPLRRASTWDALPQNLSQKRGWRVVARSGKDQNNPWRVAGLLMGSWPSKCELALKIQLMIDRILDLD